VEVQRELLPFFLARGPAAATGVDGFFYLKHTQNCEWHLVMAPQKNLNPLHGMGDFPGNVKALDFSRKLSGFSSQ